MKKRNVFVPVALLVLAFLAFLIRRWNEPEKKEAFNRRPSLLVYTKKALCQMECRQISKKEIEEVMKKGIINFNRSNRQARPCPMFALQGLSASNESIRVFFAQCLSETKVLACFNLKKEVECHCSGVDKVEN